MVRGETDKTATSRPDHLWPERWIKLGRNVKLKGKHKSVMPEDYEEFISLTLRTWNSKKP